MVKAKKWILKRAFDGKPKIDDFSLEIEDLPEPRDGEVLCEALYLSVDPYMRASKLKVGDAIIGEQVARVIASKNAKFPKGTFVRLSPGWRSHTLVTDVSKLRGSPDLGDLPLSLGLGAVGMPGATAYLVMENVLKPKAGGTILINAAAGAVGSLAGQMAKMKGCTVIGFAGSKEKVAWLKEIGFDYAYNYKTEDIGESIDKAASGGVDYYFDHVGGEFTGKVLPRMKKRGRMAAVGCIESYNEKGAHKGPYPYATVVGKSLTIQGFLIYDNEDTWPGAEVQMAKWIKEGKLKYKESVTEGFENMPQAFMGLFEGSNIGKAIVKV